MNNKKFPRVLLALSWYDHRLHRGIETYAREQGWQLTQDFAREKLVPWGWQGDGILAWLGAGDELADFVAHARIPTLDFSFRRPDLPFARVLEYTAETARLVAEHYLARGFRHFLFYSDTPDWILEERGAAFLKILRLAGHDASWLRWLPSAVFRLDRKSWQRKRQWLIQELQRCPKPLAVFAANDGIALEVLEACEDAAIPVPDQVSIVGAGNSLLAVDAMDMPITSVDPDMESIGYRGAQELDKLMRGKPVPKRPIRIAPARVIARKSSDLIAVPDAPIARALRLMWNRGSARLSVATFASIAGMSRRNFHTRFLKGLGRTPGLELQNVKIHRAKGLLITSNEKLESIAAKCGYNGANSLSIAFRRITGMSPGQFRAKSAPNRLRRLP